MFEELFKKVENSTQNLRFLGVDLDNYGKLFVLVLNLKLPSDVCTLFAQKTSPKVKNLDEVLEIFICELEANEQASLTVKAEKGHEKSKKNCTTGALISTSKLSNHQASSHNPASVSRNKNKSCLYPQVSHPLFLCTKVNDPNIRKNFIFKNRLCLICLDNSHIASKCTSNYSCKKCESRHNIFICTIIKTVCFKSKLPTFTWFKYCNSPKTKFDADLLDLFCTKLYHW